MGVILYGLGVLRSRSLARDAAEAWGGVTRGVRALKATVEIILGALGDSEFIRLKADPERRTAIASLLLPRDEDPRAALALIDRLMALGDLNVAELHRRVTRVERQDN